MFEIKFNLQMFADAGTVTNTTTGDVNAYDGTAHATGALSPTMKTYYDTELLENARAEMVHAQFAKKQGLPKNRGRKVEWRKWNTLPNASKLTEGVIPTGEKLGMTYIDDTIDQYGIYVTVSDVLELHAIDDVILGASEELGASSGKTQDELVRNDLVTGTNVLYADKVVAGTVTPINDRANLTVDCKLTPDVVNQAVTILKKMHAPKFNGKYVAVIHPSVAYDLRSSDEWIEVHKYAKPDEIFSGEIGELHGVRFIESTQAKVVRNDADTLSVYFCLFLGKDAYGTIDPDGGALEMIVKPKEQVGGPLNQFSTIGYKLETNGAKILYQERILRVECCGKYSTTDTAN